MSAAAFTANRRCFELSRADIERLVIRKLLEQFPDALPISIDFEPRSSGGFCHCWWVPGEKKAEGRA